MFLCFCHICFSHCSIFTSILYWVQICFLYEFTSFLVTIILAHIFRHFLKWIYRWEADNNFIMHITIFRSHSWIKTKDFKCPAQSSLETNFLKNEALRSLKINSEFGRADHNTSSSVVSNLFTQWLIQF